MPKWMRSDLIGIPATLLAFGVFALSLAAFYVAGPVAGIVIAVPLWAGILYLALRTVPMDLAGVTVSEDARRHRVLVVADEGLDHVDLVAEVCRRGTYASCEVMIVAPVTASGPTHALADDIDREEAGAQQRVDRTVEAFERRGVTAHGHVDDEGNPMQALLDGMREFAANEVVLVPGAESGWDRAETLADRVRAEVGVPVTELPGGAGG